MQFKRWLEIIFNYFFSKDFVNLENLYYLHVPKNTSNHARLPLHNSYVVKIKRKEKKQQGEVTLAIKCKEHTRLHLGAKQSTNKAINSPKQDLRRGS